MPLTAAACLHLLSLCIWRLATSSWKPSRLLIISQFEKSQQQTHVRAQEQTRKLFKRADFHGRYFFRRRRYSTVYTYHNTKYYQIIIMCVDDQNQTQLHMTSNLLNLNWETQLPSQFKLRNITCLLNFCSMFNVHNIYFLCSQHEY